MHRPIVLAALLVASARPADCQQAVGRIEGAMYDSLTAGPLSGAIVTLVAPGTAAYRAATSDRGGRFRLDSVPAGRYTVSFATTFLDSLEIVLPPREVTLAAGERMALSFATPSRATLFTAACPASPSMPGRGALVGQVADAESDAPLPDAGVVVSWSEIGLDPRTFRPTSTPRTAEVRTDSRGLYRVCNLPTDTWVMVQAQHADKAGAAVRTLVRDEAGVLLQRLSISRAAALDIAASDADTSGAADTVSRRRTGTAVITGRVLDGAGVPVGGAQLQVLDGASIARSDAAGRFVLGGLPAGTQVLQARRVGFAPAEHAVELRADRTVTQDVRLAKALALDSVLVTARRSRYADFERRAGGGRTASAVFTDRDLARLNLTRPSDLFRGRVVGFDLHYSRDSIRVRSTRGPIGLSTKECFANIVIDGMQWQEIDMLHPDDIGRVEVYRGGATAPIEYDSPCGTIVFWTKR